MLDYPLSNDQGYQLLGQAYGRGLLKARSFTEAAEEWKNPRHEEFSGRNLWSLYNGVTEVYKKLQPVEIMQRHLDLHKFGREVMGLNPVATTFQDLGEEETIDPQ